MDELNKLLGKAIKDNNVDEIKRLKKEIKLLKLKTEKELWLNLKTFKDIYDIPHLPKPLLDFHIKALIRCGAIPKKKLIIGEYYLGRNRNTKIAQWNGEEFVYLREMKYIEKCFHFEDDNGFALFTPLKKIEN